MRTPDFLRDPLHHLLHLGLRIAAYLLPVVPALAQDNVLVYGNSIVFAPTVAYFKDLVVQSGAVAPNVVQSIAADKKTSDYVAQIGLITSSLPAGETWRAMIVEGGTIENAPQYFDPAIFQANMMTLANALYAHSPGALFVGHETGADHPNSSKYPGLAPDPSVWLGWSHDAYAAAAAAITAAHPNSPPAAVAAQGTCYAATAGYPAFLYETDLHHLSKQGRLLSAMLWYVEIYGGRIEDIEVDFAVSTPLVTRLLADNITEAKYLRLVGFADRSQPAMDRPFPGSDADFQLRSTVDDTTDNLTTFKQAFSGSTVRLRLYSPLGAAQSSPAIVFGQVVPAGQQPNGGTPPELWLDGSQMFSLLQVTDLSGGPTDLVIPPGLNGKAIWLQAASRDGGTGMFVYSDAKQVLVR
jgi:hypothetical protein